MTATDELRRLLDERGVPWKEHRHQMPGSMQVQVETLWGQPTGSSGRPLRGVYHYRATQIGDDRLFLEAQLATPEQAIAATIGPGTCRDVGKAAVFRCSACGWCSPIFTFGAEMPCYCPCCGRRVVDE